MPSSCCLARAKYMYRTYHKIMVFAGFSLTKAEVIAVVHVGETTLSKRVSEFAATNEASLTAQKFKQYVIKDEEAEEEHLQALRDPLRKPALEGPDEEYLCPHASKPLQSFAYDKSFNVLKCHSSLLSVIVTTCFPNEGLKRRWQNIA